MIGSVMKRLNIVRKKLENDPYLQHSQWRDVAHEMFKHYGHCKENIRRRMKVEDTESMLRVEIDGRVVYWPDNASVARLAEMYFEVFHPSNNHYFDIPQMKLRQGDVVIDCGACEGYFTLKALETGVAKVYCIEPGKAAVRCLQKSFSADIEAGRVSIHACLVGDKIRKVEFCDDPSDPTVCQISSKTGDSSDTAFLKPTPMLTIDEICTQFDVPKVNFIKADVEGGEVGLVHGAEKTLERFRPHLAIAVYHAPENANLVVSFIESLRLGYKIKVKGIVDYDGIPRPVMVHCYQDETVRP